PEIPVSLVPMLFGTRDTISLHTPTRTVILRRPSALAGNLLVADRVTQDGASTRVQLKAIRVAAPPLHRPQPVFAPATPAPAQIERAGATWRVRSTVPPRCGWMVARRVRRRCSGASRPAPRGSA
ncbi:hypothetical protein B1A_11843, partial [mine drainage metagenome]